MLHLETAVAIQEQLTIRNKDKPDDKKVQIRIGLNMGEVMQDRGEIFGDGVNLAARLEAAAQPGGICISSFVYELLVGKNEILFQDGGEESFKNIDKPIHIYHWHPESEELNNVVVKSKPHKKPAVAVLPFINMSSDPDQEYFCDGMTEDIIAALSRSNWFNVISRNLTFAYKGVSPDIQEVAQKFAVNYVLEGSVRSQADSIRINVQLIDATNGNHVWVERFNRKRENEFAIQDEIAQQVASILSERVWQDIAKNVTHIQADLYGPYEFAFLGIEAVHHLDPVEITKGKEHLKKALQLDADLIFAHLALGFCYLCDWAFWDDPSDQALDKADEHALKLQSLAPEDAQTYRLLSRVLTLKHQYDEASQCVERALRINPNDGDIIANKGLFLLYCGHHEESIVWFDKVLALHELTPHTIDIMQYWKALAYFIGGKYQIAISTLKAISGLEYVRNLLFASCYAQLDEADKAKESCNYLLEIRPNLQLSDIGLCENFRRKEDYNHLYRALEKAGVPQISKQTSDLKLPDKPSIAILAFENMSNDSEQDFFAEGISEDIITLLSKFRSFFVIARNSAFAFKGQAIDAKLVSQKLGVQYIVEGSVRKAGAKVRITAQLIDAINDKHLWAERYDRDLEDIFAVQDEVTQAIVSMIEPQLISAERQLARRKPTENLNAWECYQRGLWHIFQYKHENTITALEFQEKAISLDPEFAGPYAAIAFSMYVHLLMGNSQNRQADMDRGLQAGLRAVALDESDPFAHVGLGRIHIMCGQHDLAIACFDRALQLNPSFALAHYGKAHSLWHCGRADEAVASHNEAIRLSPRDPLMWVFLASKAIALVMLKKYEQAIEISKQAQNFPVTGIWAYLGQLSALGLLERYDEAQVALNRVLQIQPNLSQSFIKQALPITHVPSRKHFFNGLEKAGVPT